MKVYCVITLRYGHKIEQWCKDHTEAAALIESFKSKGMDIIKTDITQPMPEDVSDLH